MKPGLRLKYSFEAMGLIANKANERLTEFTHCINNNSIYETMSEQKNRSKCVKLARAMAYQNNEETKMKLWKLFLAT